MLREKFARLGPVLEYEQVSSGTREVVCLSLTSDLSAAKTIRAILALRKRHVPILKAKRAVEAVIAGTPVVLVAPVVEDLMALAQELKESGFSMAVLPHDRNAVLAAEIGDREMALIRNSVVDTDAPYDLGDIPG